MKPIYREYVEHTWQESIIPTLHEYIKIPNKSPLFDEHWEKNGYMEDAIQLATNWCQEHAPKEMSLEIIRLENRTPLLFIEIPGDNDKTILLYGHLDKQPELYGWDADKGPWKPVLIDERLYGRGGADDGYAIFSSLTAINALQKNNDPHARCVIIIECCEESGSYDLPFYISALKEKIGEPELVICLDSGCGNYDQLWSTTSLRGLIGGNLRIEILKEGVHSGLASGVVPSSFRILRELLSRIEDESSGDILLKDLQDDIPEHRIEQAKQAANALNKEFIEAYPFVANGKPISDDITQLILNRTWRPMLEITGAEGLPNLKNSGNVLRPMTSVKLSLRIPPTCSSEKASVLLKTILEQNPPYGANVEFECEQGADGWHAPKVKAWLWNAMNNASKLYFGKPAMATGEGGSIPFMGMLGDMFPKAQFLITGVLGPHSNAHGPNEFLHLPTAKSLTSCVAAVIRDHYVS